MKCGAHVIKRPNRNGDMRVNRVVSWDHAEGRPDLLELKEGETVAICDGHIAVNVEAVDEPEWGDHYAMLQIEYKCSKCERSWFEELPHDAEELSEFLTEVLARLPEEEAEMLRVIRREKAIAYAERSRRISEEFYAKRAAENKASVDRVNSTEEGTDGLL